MTTRRPLILVASLVMALLAASLAWGYVKSADRRAYADSALVKVFRVKKDLPKGAPGERAIDDGFVASDVMPQRFRPGTALTDLNVIRGKVALTDLSAGQVVVEGQFVDPKIATVSFAQRIPSGQVAITVQVDAVRGVANLIVPGDKVNLLVTAADGEHTLLQNVNVIAVGTTPAPQPGEVPPEATATGEPQVAGLITFAVPPAAAQKIAFVTSDAGRAGGLYLTLVPPDNQPLPVAPVNGNNLFQGPLTPYDK